MTSGITAAQLQQHCIANKVTFSIDAKGGIRTLSKDNTLAWPSIEALNALAPRNDRADFAVTLDADGYYSLAAVFERAFKQASEGKGKERHANSMPFDQQPMQTIARGHGVGFLTGQAAKKCEESHGLPHDHAVAELLGAINYLAGAVIYLEARRKEAVADASLVDAVVDAMRVPLPGANDNWVEWSGGAMPPIDRNTLVQLKMKNGYCTRKDTAGGFTWENPGGERDIVAYRICTQAA